MATTYDYAELDTASKVRAVCKDKNAAAINLTSCTVKLYWTLVPDSPTPTSRTMSITDAANGKAEYQFQEGELTPGLITLEVEITDASGCRETSLNTPTFRVRARIWRDL